MLPADQVLVQKCLSATLAKVAAMQQGFIAAKNSLKQQEQALYKTLESTAGESAAPVALQPPAPSPSILEGDVDMQKINNAIQKLTSGCDCPNLSK
jgi:hypothetical protein